MTVFRNRMAVVLWIFMAVWMTFPGLMTYVVHRDEASIEAAVSRFNAAAGRRRGPSPRSPA